VALVSAAGGCNAAWGVDDLVFGGPTGGTTPAAGGGGAGSQGGGGATGGAGGAGGHGGSGGAGGTPCTLGPFGPAEEVTELNTNYMEWDPSVSADGLTLVLASTRSGGLGYLDVWVATRPSLADPFGALENVSDVNSQNTDTDPELSADGLALYLATNRPGGTGDMDIWTATRASANQPFGEPTEVTATNTVDNDRDPALSVDLLTLYFASDRSGGQGGFDIWVATRAGPSAPFGAPQLVAAASSIADDTNPALSADGLTLYFTSHRAGGAGGGDLWFVERSTPTGAFGVAQNLGGPNTADDETDPTVTADGRTLYFASDRLGGPVLGDIYRTERDCE